MSFAVIADTTSYRFDICRYYTPRLPLYATPLFTPSVHITDTSPPFAATWTRRYANACEYDAAPRACDMSMRYVIVTRYV